ncbi:hypothetical protein X949_5857 [Burkholderia pseudomallei MSHR5609]|nr:hypothetical protein X949_5857 [Burkholderia pseudomallei MSHR5609]KGX50674.1 hypothetical protein Y024_5881 [Burkholderia pseudomallei TSV44]
MTRTAARPCRRRLPVTSIRRAPRVHTCANHRGRGEHACRVIANVLSLPRA